MTLTRKLKYVGKPTNNTCVGYKTKGRTINKCFRKDMYGKALRGGAELSSTETTNGKETTSATPETDKSKVPKPPANGSDPNPPESGSGPTSVAPETDTENGKDPKPPASGSAPGGPSGSTSGEVDPAKSPSGPNIPTSPSGSDPTPPATGPKIPTPPSGSDPTPPIVPEPGGPSGSVTEEDPAITAVASFTTELIENDERINKIEQSLTLNWVKLYDNIVKMRDNDTYDLTSKNELTKLVHEIVAVALLQSV